MKMPLILALLLLGCVTEKEDESIAERQSNACLAEPPFTIQSWEELSSDLRFYKGPPAMSRCADINAAVVAPQNLDGVKADVTIFDSTCSVVYSAKNMSPESSEGLSENSYGFWTGKIAGGKTVGSGLYFAEVIYTKEDVTDTLEYALGLVVEDSCIIK